MLTSHSRRDIYCLLIVFLTKLTLIVSSEKASGAVHWQKKTHWPSFRSTWNDSHGWLMWLPLFTEDTRLWQLNICLLQSFWVWIHLSLTSFFLVSLAAGIQPACKQLTLQKEAECSTYHKEKNERKHEGILSVVTEIGPILLSVPETMVLCRWEDTFEEIFYKNMSDIQRNSERTSAKILQSKLR